MTSSVIYLGELRTNATHTLSGTEVISDAPLDNQGKGAAFSPTDLCATSLASCMITIMGISARNHNMNIDGVSAQVTKTMAADPRRIAGIQVILKMPEGPFTEVQKKILETAGLNCPVAKSLHPDIRQDIQFVW
jgi:putative redox protein